MTSLVTIPIDIYDATTEMVVIFPLGGVLKDSITIDCDEGVLHVTGRREKPILKTTLIPTKEQCFR